MNGEEEKLDGPVGETKASDERDVEYPVTVQDDPVFVLGDNREGIRRFQNVWSGKP